VERATRALRYPGLGSLRDLGRARRPRSPRAGKGAGGHAAGQRQWVKGGGASFTPAQDSPDISVNRWLSRRNNANNGWNFNGTTGNLNNNNVNNANRVQAVTNLPRTSSHATT
jgi:hypothetical protein